MRQVLFGLMQENGHYVDDEVLHTLFCEAEHIVNSRPLTTDSSDPSDPRPLSPNDVLIMKPHVLLPFPGSFDKPDLYTRKRWRRVQYLMDVFWYRWRREFLAARQERSKWVQRVPNVKVGDIVLIKEDSPRNCWPLARVTAVTGSDDGCVRSVTLKTKSSTLHRPIHKILVLIHNLSD